jgi:hypothetical protein
MPPASPPPTDTGDPLGRALDQAIAGKPETLHTLLSRGSRLPGTRMNSDLADAFADLCRARGARADAAATALARLSADVAPGGTAEEFLPVCGVLALSSRAAADATARARLLTELHARADDLRYRVRDAVVAGLARIGAAAGDALVADLAAWMDGYFHAAAVLRALENPAFLGAARDAPAVVARFDAAFTLLRDAPRAAARWPGHKALVEVLSTAPAAAALTLGAPIFDMLERWAQVTDPVLRDAVRQILDSRRLRGRFGAEVDRVARALAASAAPVRNPDHDVGRTRDRSGHRRRRGRT